MDNDIEREGIAIVTLHRMLMRIRRIDICTSGRNRRPTTRWIVGHEGPRLCIVLGPTREGGESI